MMDRQAKWDLRYLDLAHHVAGWSKDPSTKVGCILVRPNNSVASMGFNGFAPGADDDPKLYENREYKYKNVIHAEANALNFLDGTPAEGFCAYTSFPPCPDCMRLLGEAGVARVVSPPVNIEGHNLEWIDQWKRAVMDSLVIARGFRMEWVAVSGKA